MPVIRLNERRCVDAVVGARQKCCSTISLLATDLLSFYRLERESTPQPLLARAARTPEKWTHPRLHRHSRNTLHACFHFQLSICGAVNAALS